MRFSDHFKIKPSRSDNWFDPVLSIDTPLFIDPFLIYAQETGPFRGSHKFIISFFDTAFKLIAASKGNIDHHLYKKAIDIMLFPEREELCLGYTRGGTKGSGSGRELANAIGAAIWEAIKTGMTEITHFEEVAILREGLGADRISDATGGLLLKRFADFTSSVCRRHKV